MALKELREAKGYSQSKLATAAKVNVRTLQDYELGRSDINGAKLKTLLKLCRTLECRLENIIDDPELTELIKEYEKI